MRCRIVEPELIRLPLTDGDFLDVKRELNAGERRRVFAAMVRGGVVPGEATQLDAERIGVTRVMAYVVSWSFIDRDGRPIPVSESALDSFDGDTVNEISAAIDAHEAEQDARRADEKKTRTGDNALKVISGSRG